MRTAEGGEQGANLVEGKLPPCLAGLGGQFGRHGGEMIDGGLVGHADLKYKRRLERRGTGHGEPGTRGDTCGDPRSVELHSGTSLGIDMQALNGMELSQSKRRDGFGRGLVCGYPQQELSMWMCGRGVRCGCRGALNTSIDADGDLDCTERVGNSQGLSMGMWEQWETRGDERGQDACFPFALKPTGAF